MRLTHVAYGFDKTRAIESVIYGQDYNKRRGTGSFNPDCWFTRGWQQLVFRIAMAQAKQSAWELHDHWLGKARTWSMGHHLLNHKLLCDLGDMGNPIYSLMAEKTGHGRPVAMAPFDRTSTAVGAPLSGAPARKITSVATVQAGGLL
jgi:hypothetical protein